MDKDVSCIETAIAHLRGIARGSLNRNNIRETIHALDDLSLSLSVKINIAQAEHNARIRRRQKCVSCGAICPEWETSDGERMCSACVLAAYDITPGGPCCAYCGETLEDKHHVSMGDNGDFYCDALCALRAHGVRRV